MKKFLIILLVSIVLFITFMFLKYFNVFVGKKYSNEDFNIQTYISKVDKDNDGIDDQTDIINNTKEYIKTKPKYQSKYYKGGYPDDNYGVCTDVVSFALKDAGYDLKELVNNHIMNNHNLYDIETVDANIDFRRVKNLIVYFEHNAIKLTNDYKEIESWQGGDIVIFKKHIGIVSDNRDKDGVSFVIHHASPYQIHYEENILAKRDDIVGHYRIS